ncbi:unnamed protein product [Pleuronectes platessa]|uniref:Uncharacterized protein n=1 Tax=Pleuronectes platessa TaxID=8262 RepID=A0A9N7VD52_PLEPL|nr:unnamed protein product [Pleuronectes platessa]
MKTSCFVALRLRSWIFISFGNLLFLLPPVTVLAGSSQESEPWRGTAPRSSDTQPLLQNAFTPVQPVSLQIQYDTNMTENYVHRRRRSSSSGSDDAEHSELPRNLLTTSHLSTLRDLLSDKKISVRLGLRVSLSGPSELLDPQFLLSLSKQPGLYNTGGKPGVFTMRIVGIKKAAAAP